MSENHQKCTCKLFSHDENAYLFIRSNNADFTKYVDYVNKDKKTGEAVIEFGAWRACSFATNALIQEERGKKEWKLASPSDSYKY